MGGFPGLGVDIPEVERAERGHTMQRVPLLGQDGGALSGLLEVAHSDVSDLGVERVFEGHGLDLSLDESEDGLFDFFFSLGQHDVEGDVFGQTRHLVFALLVVVFDFLLIYTLKVRDLRNVVVQVVVFHEGGIGEEAFSANGNDRRFQVVCDRRALSWSPSTALVEEVLGHHVVCFRGRRQKGLL